MSISFRFSIYIPHQKKKEIASYTPVMVLTVKYPLCFFFSHVVQQYELFERKWKISHYGKQKSQLHMLGSHYVLSLNPTNGTQRRTLINPWKVPCMYCSIPKGTSWAEAMSNSKNQAHSLSHCQVEDIRQVVGNYKVILICRPCLLPTMVTKSIHYYNKKYYGKGEV